MFRKLGFRVRLLRGKKIPNNYIINFTIEKEPFNLIANIQGSGTNVYVINIAGEDDYINIIHDCPDFKKGNILCKHIVKILLVCDHETCSYICKDKDKIHLISDISSIRKSKAISYEKKAEELVKESKYLEAINYLHESYKESKNIEDIQKILAIASEHNLPEQNIKYITYSDSLVSEYSHKYEELIESILSRQDDYSFTILTETILNIRKLLPRLPENIFDEIIENIDFKLIKNPLLRYLLLYKFKNKIDIHEYFKDISKEIKKTKKGKLKPDLNEFFKNKVEQLVDEAIIDMESQDIIDTYIKIIDHSPYDDTSKIYNKIRIYKQKLDGLYREGLKQKHAFIRSLVIDNYGTDKLVKLEFSTSPMIRRRRRRRRYSTLIWTRPKKGQDPLFYYIMEKCGFDRHHMDYTSKQHFIDNYPVFANIFSSNNPIPNEITSFWKEDDPEIENRIYAKSFLPLDFSINIEDLQNYILIEWDLAQNPIFGSYICQFSDGYMIPDLNHPLTHETKPFDLIICKKEPIAIKGNNIRILRPIKRINPKSAVELIYNNIEFVASFLPFDIIQDLKNMKIDEIDAVLKVQAMLKKSFSPNKEDFYINFKDFVNTKIKKDLNNTYLKLISKPNNKNKILRLIGFQHYIRIFTDIKKIDPFKNGDLKRDSLHELKMDFYRFIAKKLIEIINDKTFDHINLKILKKYPKFKKFTVKIIHEIKKQLENCKIYRLDENEFDIFELYNSYAGQKIIKLTDGQQEIITVSSKKLKGIIEDLNFLEVKLPEIVDVDFLLSTEQFKHLKLKEKEKISIEQSKALLRFKRLVKKADYLGLPKPEVPKTLEGFDAIVKYTKELIAGEIKKRKELEEIKRKAEKQKKLTAKKAAEPQLTITKERLKQFPFIKDIKDALDAGFNFGYFHSLAVQSVEWANKGLNWTLSSRQISRLEKLAEKWVYFFNSGGQIKKDKWFKIRKTLQENQWNKWCQKMLKELSKKGRLTQKQLYWVNKNLDTNLKLPY